MVVKCTAPIRICDLGGWTDTWFAGTGKVLNLAVFPSVEVTVITRSRKRHEPPIRIHAENYHDSYDINARSRSWAKHPLIEAGFAIDLAPGRPIVVSSDMINSSRMPSTGGFVT